MSITSSRSPSYPRPLSDLAINRKFPWPPSQVWEFARVTHRTPKTVYLLLPIYYKWYFKGYKWTVRWRNTWVRSAKVFPCEVGLCHPPSMWMCSPAWKLYEPSTLGTFMEVSSHRHDRLLLNFQSLFPLQRMRDGSESSKLLIMACSFWWQVPIQEPTKSSLIRTKDAPITRKNSKAS